MKILQMLPALMPGDAVGNDALAIEKVIREMGYDTTIYAGLVHEKLRSRGQNWDKLSVSPEDVILYHQATGNDMCFQLEHFPCRKIMIYHNITPPEFFCGFSKDVQRGTEYGLRCTKYLADKVDCCLADSEFNKQDLLNMGYRCPIDVRPILIPFSDYQKQLDAATLQKYRDGATNILFVGRIAPNKKFEDLIRAFYYYKTEKNPGARLLLVGSCGGMENYDAALKEYVKTLGLADVVFSGQVSFPEILAYYRAADLFLCMSEHEGFCVPLVEAMFFGVPIVAYDSTAIASTLGGSGVLVKEKDPVFVGEVMHRVLSDEKLREQLIEDQKNRLEAFAYEKVRDQLVAYLEAFLGRDKTC